jgi:1-acyl-sn-glycerol-3-phosphate acyltransferase
MGRIGNGHAGVAHATKFHVMKRDLLAWCVRLLTGARLSSDPEGNDITRVYYANHSSHLDFVVIWAALPSRLRERVRPVAAADYWARGAARRWLAQRVFRAVLIPRERIKPSDDPIGKMAAELEQGNDLIIFPEGTRSPDGHVGEFHSGLHALALKHPQSALIPVYLENLNRILPKGEFLLVPVMGNATFGPPCEGPHDGESRRDFLRRARSALLELSSHPPDT